MKYILALASMAVAFIATTITLTNYNESQAAKIHAKAFFLAQQGQARLDSAQALFPFFIVGVIVLVILLVVATILATNELRIKQNQGNVIERHYIENRIILLAPPTAGSNRQMYKQLSTMIQNQPAQTSNGSLIIK